jgi:hypothetical protein
MERIGLRGGGIGLRAGDVKVDHHWFLSAADDDSFYGLVFPGVKSLVRDVGRDIHEIAGAGFVDEFEAGATAEAGASAHDVDYRLDFAVVVRASFGVGMDDHRAGPSFCAPTRAWEMASARVMPGVCGGLVSRLLARTMRRPWDFQSGALGNGALGIGDPWLVSSLLKILS